MKKLREIKERRKNNKGFSLVELIIVIAIMAILVAILAPQFLKYVERSRNTADIANAREISNAIIAYIADTEVEDNTITTGGATVTVEKGNAVIGGADHKTVLNALKEAGITAQTSDDTTLNDIKCKSKNNWTSYVISVKVDDKGVVNFTYEGKGGSNPANFAAAFQQGSGSSSGSGSGSGSGTVTSNNP